MARPITATHKDRILSYMSVTVRLAHSTIEALNKLDKGKRAEFIRNAIDEKLNREGLA